MKKERSNMMNHTHKPLMTRRKKKTRGVKFDKQKKCWDNAPDRETETHDYN
jgi:hypothetical protein